MARQRQISLNSNCCTLEGNIFLPYLLQQIFLRKDSWQTAGDYAIPKGSTLEEESKRSFNITRSEWQAFRHTCLQQGLSAPKRLQATQYFVRQFLNFGLGYNLQEVAPIFVPYFDRQKPSPEDRTYPVTLLANNVPVAIVSEEYSLDERCAIVTSPDGILRKSPFQMVQELINGCNEYNWGLVSNGRSIRLVHRLMALTNRHYLEFDLQTMFGHGSDEYAEFFRLWLVMHSSRTRIQKDAAGQTIWDLWFQDGVNSGEPAREALSRNLEQALQLLGEGFLNSQFKGKLANEALLHKLQNRELTVQDFQHQLLQLIYRFFFVFCLEERHIINFVTESDQANALARQRYLEGYAFHRFIQQAHKQRFRNHYHDAYISAVRVFTALDQGEKALALPALGGLFQSDRCPDLMTAQLENRYFFAAMEKMRWADLNGSLNLIDYKNMDTEELGSIYEGLLELIPHIDWDESDANRHSFSFIRATGNERKRSGSYYTPDSLVQSLLKTALDPVIEQKLQDNPDRQEQALLKLSVIDPACGSGHFLLAAARRIAEKLADVRAGNEHASQLLYRKALHDVVQNCIYGVDLNPMAVELTKIALWLEGFAENTPLSFLDHHIKVGNALLGVFDVDVVKHGIPDDAYAVTTEKNVPPDLAPTCKDTCNSLRKLNKTERAHSHIDDYYIMPLFGGIKVIDLLPNFDQATERDKTQLYQRYQQELQQEPELIASDLYIAAFLSAKNNRNELLVPTSKLLFKQLYEPDTLTQMDLESIHQARQLCAKYHVLHWPFAFPEQFDRELAEADRGFDCVLGNPPWDKAVIEDVQYFIDKNPMIATATPTSKRQEMIKALAQGTFAAQYDPKSQTADSVRQERELYYSYVYDKHILAMSSNFWHLGAEQGGRFPLTGTGSANVAYYFAELAYKLRKPQGTAGIVEPAGIITDSNTQAFSRKILQGQIGSAYHFDNVEGIFKAVAQHYSFILLTLKKSEKADFVFYATQPEQLDEPQRHVHFESGDFQLINPNTQTCVLIRTDADLRLCRKLYQRAPVLYNERNPNNPWNIQTLCIFNMSLDSALFHDNKESASMLPLYEGKMIHQFEHRWVTFDPSWPKNEHFRDVTQNEKENPSFVSNPRYWVEAAEVKKKLHNKQWTHPWMLAWRDIARATDERTLIATILPAAVAVGHKAPLLLPQVSDKQAACLLATLNSLVVDFVERIKQPSTNVLIFLLKQLPILPSEAFKEQDIEFICQRVAKLTRTADDINAVWLTDYPSYTFQKPKERLQIRAELDAYIARMYGLTRDELRYILDPSDVYGKDHPSVTFPSLKSNQEKEFGEYLTQRLVLQAFDDLEAGRLV